MRDRRRRDASDQTAIPPAEWAAAAVGLAIVIFAITVIARDALPLEKTPPALSVEVEAVHRQETGYLLEFRVHNSGQSTAAEVQVEGELRTNDSRETSDATLDFVPAQSSRSGGLLFRKDPHSGTLTIRTKGWQRP